GASRDPRRLGWGFPRSIPGPMGGGYGTGVPCGEGPPGDPGGRVRGNRREVDEVPVRLGTGIVGSAGVLWGPGDRRRARVAGSAHGWTGGEPPPCGTCR